MEPISALAQISGDTGPDLSSPREITGDGLQSELTPEEESVLTDALAETAVSTIVMLMWSDIQRNQRMAEESMRDVQK